MNIILVPPADKELDDAINYYNEEIPGLGEVFYEEFIRAADLVSLFPSAWRKVGDNTRRAKIKKFPYLILYVVEKDCILITCVAHQHRDPRYYNQRVF